MTFIGNNRRRLTASFPPLPAVPPVPLTPPDPGSPAPELKLVLSGQQVFDCRVPNARHVRVPLVVRMHAGGGEVVQDGILLISTPMMCWPFATCDWMIAGILLL